MKIAIGYYLQKGPWGGGNQFAQSLVKALEARGDKVCFNLKDNDIDIILLTDPRWRNKSISFGTASILKYLVKRNPKAIVVHRINECDERKGTNYMNKKLRRANYIADHTVFIASWLEELNLWQRNRPMSVVKNGADQAIFKQEINMPWDGKSPLKLVTHHWGGNWMKGFNVYSKIDKMLISPEWRNIIDFTYIGNLPKKFQFQNAKYLPPLNGKNLAKELSKHHIYITASINEPAGMHHIEGALAGLPILYRQSGALPEYCKGFGIGFENDDFIPALKEILTSYSKIKSLMPKYSNTADQMCSQYLSLFDKLIDNRNMIVSKRNLWKSPWDLLKTIII